MDASRAFVPLSRRRFLSSALGSVAAVAFTPAFGTRVHGGVARLQRNQRCQGVLDRLKGPMASITIPYNTDFSIDYGSLRSWVEFMCEKKQPILFLTYGDSELGFLTEEEIEKVTRTVTDQARGRTLVIGGTGAWWTGRTIEFINRVADSGVDAINVHIGDLARGEDEVYDAFRTIDARTEVPLLTVDRKYSLDLMKRLAQLPKVIGDKCHEELYNYYAFCRATKEYNFAVLSAGQMKHFLFGYFAGSAAYLCPAAPFAPEITLKFYRALTEGKYERARDIVYDFEEPLLEITGKLGYPHNYKSVLHLMGLYKTTLMRPPRRGNRLDELGELKAFLEKKGVLSR